MSSAPPTLNARAEEAAAYGLKVGYHNHDHELDQRNRRLGRRSKCSPTCSTPRYCWRSTSTGPQRAGSIRSRWCSGSGDRVHAVHIKDGPMRAGHLDPRTAEGPVPGRPG